MSFRCYDDVEVKTTPNLSWQQSSQEAWGWSCGGDGVGLKRRRCCGWRVWRGDHSSPKLPLRILPGVVRHPQRKSERGGMRSRARRSSGNRRSHLCIVKFLSVVFILQLIRYRLLKSADPHPDHPSRPLARDELPFNKTHDSCPPAALRLN
jgi:hypothetical protein